MSMTTWIGDPVPRPKRERRETLRDRIKATQDHILTNEQFYSRATPDDYFATVLANQIAIMQALQELAILCRR